VRLVHRPADDFINAQRVIIPPLIGYSIFRDATVTTSHSDGHRRINNLRRAALLHEKRGKAISLSHFNEYSCLRSPFLRYADYRLAYLSAAAYQSPERKATWASGSESAVGDDTRTSGAYDSNNYINSVLCSLAVVRPPQFDDLAGPFITRTHSPLASRSGPDTKVGLDATRSDA
jgi:hypothetical protein